VGKWVAGKRMQMRQWLACYDWFQPMKRNRPEWQYAHAFVKIGTCSAVPSPLSR